MPVLPLSHPEPFAATIGVMLYPGPNDGDARKARAFAAHYLAVPMQRYIAAGHQPSPETLLRLMTDGGEVLDDLQQRWVGGLCMGDLLKARYALFCMDENLSSWENTYIVMANALGTKPGSRSKFAKIKRQFISVGHLWAAWSMREGSFETAHDVGYDGYADFQAFLLEAETFCYWGQTWKPKTAKSEPPLPREVWRVPGDWHPPEWQEGWPDTGRLPHVTLPEKLLEGIKPGVRR